MTPSARAIYFSNVCKRKPRLELKRMAPESPTNDALQSCLKALVFILIFFVLYAAFVVGFSLPNMEAI